MLKKDITFIYDDSIQKQVFELIANEAKKRGYQTHFSDNKFEKCEIGFYCDHINFPNNSKFSIIMLHDITQQYGNWPDIWLREPWNIYDVGILPGKTWVENWEKCSQYYYARPKRDMYLVGWPKADIIAGYDLDGIRKEFELKYHIDSGKKTILYAPAWENDNKQDDFVRAMQKLDVNILIKQAPWNSELYPEQIKNIEAMKKLHEGLPGVHIIDPSTNILYAIIASDILVSEESSTMCESVMIGKPAISVSNWLIPDVTPSRYPADNYDFVIKTKKENLSDCVEDVIKNYDKFSAEAEKYSKDNFQNIGNCSKIIMDIIDHYVDGTLLQIEPLTPNADVNVPKNIERWRLMYRRKKNFYYRVVKRNKFIENIYSKLIKLKHFLCKS